MKIFGFEIRRAGKEKFSWGNPDLHQKVITVGGYPFYMWDMGDFDASKADKVDANFARAVQITADSICSLPIILKQDNEEIEAHEFIDLIRKPNSLIRFDELLWHVIQGLMVTGRSFWRFPLGTALSSKPPTEIWPVIPSAISLKYVEDIPAAFILQARGSKITLPLEEVVYFKFYDMRNPFEGSGLVEAIRDEMNTSKKALRYHEMHLKSGPLQDLLFIDETLAGLQKPQREEFTDSLQDKYGGSEKANKSPILPPGIKPHERPSKLQQMAFGELVKFNREQVNARVGIPPSKGGIYEYANYANAVIQDRGFWTDTAIPMATKISLTIKHQILDRFWPDEDLKVVFDVSGIKALQEDSLQQAQRLRTATGRPFMTINEAREEMGKEPVEGGDEIPSAGLAYDPDLQNGQQQQKKFWYIDDVINQRKPLDRAGEWFRFDKRVKMAEGRFTKFIRRYFAGQRARLIKSLKDYTAEGQFMSRIIFADEAKPFDIQSENEYLTAQIKPFYKKEMDNAGRQAMASLGMAPAFDITNPNVVKKIQDLTNRSKKINDATFADIKGLLKEAYEEKWNQSQLVKQIYELYGDYGRARAEMVARTEMAGVYNTGAEEGYRQGGVTRKEWMASIDDATRPEHAAADGQIVSIDQPFNVGGEMLMAPGDPNGSAANVINCRCTLLPVIE